MNVVEVRLPTYKRPKLLLRALALTEQPVHLHLLGTPARGYTDALRALADSLGPAARLFETGNPAALAAAIDSLLADPQALASARRHGWELGQGRFSWEAESGRLVDLVAGVAA